MAHHEEPMDIDSDFDNKENSLHHTNVLPFTEKGYEELDVSELNMKLRYSVTPVSSPMSKSYTANCLDNRSFDSGDNSLNTTVNENTNLTRSLNLTITKNDNVLKSLKALPLQKVLTEQLIDNNIQPMLRPFDTKMTPENGNIHVTVTSPSDVDENMSLPSSTSSALQTPEATTPTKDIQPKDGGSPIMRGLKSVLNMFRSSQSPIPPADDENSVKPSTLVSPENADTTTHDKKTEQVLASTPISAHRKKEMSPTKRNSPLKDNSIVFNQDLERELQWKDETTIIFSQERIPIHKLLFQPQQSSNKENQENKILQENLSLNSTTDYMDLSQNDSIKDISMIDINMDCKKGDNTLAGESDSEFVDCETTFTKNESLVVETNEMTAIVDKQDLNLTKDVQSENESGSRLRQIILNTTQDILDATLSIKPEDLLPETINQTIDYMPDLAVKTDINTSPDRKMELQSSNETGNSMISLTVGSNQENLNSIKALEKISNAIFCEQTAITNVESNDTNLDATRILVHQPSVIENIDTTVKNEIIILNDKPFDVDLLSAGGSLTENLSALDIKSVDDFKNIKELASMPPITSEEVTGTRLEDLQENVVAEVPCDSEFPVDVPLPDDDDNEKDCATESSMSVIENLVVMDVIQTNGGIDKVTLSTTTDLSEDGDLNQLDKTAVAGNNVCIYDNKEISNQPTELSTSLESQGHPKEIAVTKASNCNEMYSAPEKQFNQHVMSIITDQSISPLPDIVNNINLENPEKSLLIPGTLKTENLESTTNSNQVIIIPEVDCKLDNKDNLRDKVEIEQETQIQNAVSESDKPIVDNSVIEQSTKMFEDLPLEDPTTYITNNITTTVENVIDNTESCQINAKTTKILSTIENAAFEKADYFNVAKNLNEELVLSKNDSLFVEAISDTILKNVEENTEQPISIDILTSKDGVIVTPPNSPPIRSKGYNFNFDDMDFDPFATKTNIRMSPPLDSPNKADDIKVENEIKKSIPKKDFNRRKSQPNKRRPVAPKRKVNSTFDDTANEKTANDVVNNETIPVADMSPENVIIEEIDIKMQDTNAALQETIKFSNEVPDADPNTILEVKGEHAVEVVNEISVSINTNENELKATSSSEQSTYFSAGTSSSDSSIPSRNVFNLPEIDDSNFNPFATKCKMHQSPPPSLDISTTKTSPDSCTSLKKRNEDKSTFLEEKIETELMEKDASINLNDTTISSKVTDEKNITTREIHTEDEDTIEGPFLEADDMNLEDKLSELEIENVDMIQFNELPIRDNEENPCSDEMFIDAEAFEFLLNQNKSNTVVDSGKESLFLKFDPLFAKRMSVITSDSAVAALTKLQRRQSTPNKETQSSLQKMGELAANISNINVTRNMDLNIKEEFNEDPNFTVSKPMMVVPPAINPVTPRNKSLTPNRSNRRSFSFASPAMAVIDRLLSLSGNSSQLHDTTMTQVSREQNEADIALSQLRELLAEKEINVYNLRSESNELRDRLNTLESHVKTLEASNQDKLKKINQLNETLAEKTKINKSMAAVVEEYERTIARLIAETAQDKKIHAEERIKLINERDEQTAHLASMEVSFSDLHSKYEKSKQVILHCKANEDVFKKSIKDFEENLAKMQNNYELLKQHATSKLNHANQELEKMNKSHEAEVLKLNAMIKRKDLHITSLEESLAQKMKANEELTAICDELINKVG